MDMEIEFRKEKVCTFELMLQRFPPKNGLKQSLFGPYFLPAS